MWAVGITVGPLLKALVVFHVQSHATLMTLEAALVPDFVQTPEALDRVDGFITSCALAGTHDGLFGDGQLFGWSVSSRPQVGLLFDCLDCKAVRLALALRLGPARL